MKTCIKYVALGVFLSISLSNMNAVRPDHVARINAIAQDVADTFDEEDQFFYQALTSMIRLTDPECETILNVLEETDLSDEQIKSAIQGAVQYARNPDRRKIIENMRGLDIDELRSMLLTKTLENIQNIGK